MSSEFTIDIQLTELGFPELFEDEARPKEAPSHPCPSDSSCAPLTPPNSQTASPPSQDLNPNSTAGSKVFPVAGKPAKARDCAPTKKVVPQSKDQSDPVAGVGDSPGTGLRPNTQHEDKEHNVGAAVGKQPEAAAGPNHVRAVGGRRDGKGSGGDGEFSTRAGKEPGANAKTRPATDAEDSEETDDSDVSEEEDEEEEDDDEEEEIASDASVDGLGEQCCRVCGLTLPSAFQLREHMHVHSGARPYRCAECGKQFCHLANYRAHLRGHAQTTSVRCRVCEASFDSEESLARHLENSHFEKEFYQCDFCKRIFTCLNECRRHVETHQREPRRHQCPRCERHFRRRKSLARHLEQHAVKRSYLCTDCGQAFDRKIVLFRHSFSHLGLLPYTCVRCHRHFRLASLYRRHACQPQRIQCVACLGFFRSQEDFQRHKEETGCWGHQGTRGDGIRCMECGQAFQSSEELKKHGGAHQRVLTCSECGKGFHSALLLMSHMGGHAGQRPCLCQRCGLGFPHQQGYDSHRKHCGRPPPTPVAAKKQKKDTPTPEKVGAPPEGVWKLTLDKCPPPGSSLVMFLPVPTDSASPSLAELAARLPLGSPPANEQQTQAPVMQVVLGSGSAQSVQDQPSTATLHQDQPSTPTHPPQAMEGAVKASSTGPGQPSKAACQESLPVPGTTLKLQISQATFVPGPQKLPEAWDQSRPVKPGPAGECALAPGVSLPGGTAAGPAHPPQVTMQIVGAPGAGALYGSAVAGTPATRDQIFSKGSSWTMALKQERVEEEVRKESGEDAKKEKGLLGAVLPAMKAESMIMGEMGAVGQTKDTQLAPLMERGQTCKPIYVKIELPAHVDSGTPLSDKASARISGWARPDGPGAGLRGPNSVTSQKVKHETVADQGAREREGTTAEDGSGVFDSVEVEIRDEEVEGDQEADGGLHECVNCGKMLLEGDMVQHYMQHAMESDSPLQDCSTEMQLQSYSSPIPSPSSLPPISPPLSPPTKRQLRPRKKP